MTKNMYEPSKKKYGECSYDNETLAVMIQSGDAAAAELLLSQNEGYLTDLALEHSDWCEPEDLKQEGALALLEAAKHFDPAYGTKLLTYATPIIQSAMVDYCAHASLSVSIPSARYQQLRKVARACYEAKDDSEETLIAAVCESLAVSEKTAGELLQEYRALFSIRQLGDDVFSVSCGGDPAVVYDRSVRRALLLRLIEEVLTPREQNLVRYYLGIGQADVEGITFQELAVRLNYNDPSGAEKAYKNALRKLKANLYSGAYGRWLAIRKAIDRAKAEADSGSYVTPQTTWTDEKK